MSRSAPIRHQGNDSLFLAVEMSILSTLVGIPLHIHAEGLRGTGKTTVMRWVQEAMPYIERVPGCLYQCDPERPHCPVHNPGNRSGLEPNPRPESRQEIKSERCPMPFVEIGHGAKLGTILGSIDLERLTDPKNPAAALLPGSIPMAHRGILFVDEVNRLAETAPEITDVLLSVMGTKPGRVKIEEVGLPPWELDVQASVWAASNPDEDPGPLEDIRKQLADRFDLVVPVQRPSDASIVEQLLAEKSKAPSRVHETADSPNLTANGPCGAKTDPCAAADASAALNKMGNSVQDSSGAAEFLQGIRAKAQRFSAITVPSALLKYMAQLYVQRNVESLRAIEALELASRLVACIRQKDEVTFDELLTVMPLVLRHRVEPATLSEILKDLELRKVAGSQPKAEVKDDWAAPSSANGGEAEVPNQPPTIQTPWPDLPETQNNTKPTWFERLLSRCSGKAVQGSEAANQGASRKTGGNPAHVQGQTQGHTQGQTQDQTQGQTGSSQRLPDPSTLPPSSPPDPARRISLLSWEELIMPPDCKDTRAY